MMGKFHQRIAPVKNSLIFWALVYTLWVTFCYAPAMNGPFFFDDEHFIVNNRTVQSWDRLSDLYTTSVTEGADIRGNFYRPNQQLVYALIYKFVGSKTSLPYHLTSIVLHILSGVLLLYWLVLLGFGISIAGISILVFLVHPVQTEAVAYISGLSDPLSTVFLLGGLCCYSWAVAQRASVLPMVLPALILFIMALFTRESSVVFVPMAMLATLYMRHKGHRHNARNNIIALGVFASVALIYVWLRLTLLNFSGDFGLARESNLYTESLTVRLTTFISILWDYMKLIFYPNNLFYEKPYIAYIDLWTPRGMFGLGVLGFITVVLGGAKKWPTVALGVTLAVAALIPFSGIIPLNAMYLEHWLYIPMIGIAIIVAACVTTISRVARHRRWLLVGASIFFITVMTLLSWRTYDRARQWGDIEAFYLNEIGNDQGSVRMLNNLAMYYQANSQSDKAIMYYKRAITANHVRLPQPHHNLAQAYADRGQIGEAISEIHKALTMDPDFIYSLDFLRKIHLHLGDLTRVQRIAEVIAMVRAGKKYDFANFEREVLDP